MTTCGDCKWWAREAASWIDPDYRDYGTCNNVKVAGAIVVNGMAETAATFGCIFGEAKGGDASERTQVR
jgi:hypothetical protein